MSDKSDNKRGGRGRMLLAGLAGVLIGAAVTGGLVWTLMPGIMLHVDRSRLGFGETVEQVQQAVKAQGREVSGVRDMQKSLAKRGRQLDRRVTLVEICRPDYAQSVLRSDREVATLMPCAVAIYEEDSGQVLVSRMNTGLMGKMFGGNIAAVMGGSVARDEQAILSGILAE